jgi:hypothetical protein
VRQFNDLLRVLPPVPKAIAPSGARRNGAPGRPVAVPGEQPPGRHPQQTRAGRPGPRSYQP